MHRCHAHWDWPRSSVSIDNHPSEASVFAELSTIAAPALWRLLDPEVTGAGHGRGRRRRRSHSYHLALWALAAGTPALLGASPPTTRRRLRLAVLAGVEGGIALPEVVDADTIRACRPHLRPSSMRAGGGGRAVNDWWNAQLVTVPSIAG
jgi:hypothetical protein